MISPWNVPVIIAHEVQEQSLPGARSPRYPGLGGPPRWKPEGLVGNGKSPKQWMIYGTPMTGRKPPTIELGIHCPFWNGIQVKPIWIGYGRFSTGWKRAEQSLFQLPSWNPPRFLFFALSHQECTAQHTWNISKNVTLYKRLCCHECTWWSVASEGSHKNGIDLVPCGFHAGFKTQTFWFCVVVCRHSLNAFLFSFSLLNQWFGRWGCSDQFGTYLSINQDFKTMLSI